ncbi:MAG: ion transporter [Cyclobacteriaceae bacterium]
MLLKKRIYEILEKGEDGDQISKRFDIFIIILIILNVILVIAETEEHLYTEYKQWMDAFEKVSVLIFTLEYLLRIWTCTYATKYAHPLWGRLSFIFSFGALIDLLAILPFYLPLIFKLDGRFLRVLRLFRLFRLFKMGRYSTAFRLIQNVIRDRKEELAVSFSILVILLVVASGLMYYIENSVQPESFSSIPETMWWGVATLTTVGYGDMYPITGLGRLLAAIIAILGIGVFALPAGIIASGFEAELSKRNKNS